MVAQNQVKDEKGPPVPHDQHVRHRQVDDEEVVHTPLTPKSPDDDRDQQTVAKDGAYPHGSANHGEGHTRSVVDLFTREGC